MTSPHFSWVHLSDLHFGQRPQWLWPNFRSLFLEDLKRLSEEAGPIDLVFFTGDLTNRGAKSEFSTLTDELQEMWEMWDKLGQRPRLFTVPGNHDLERPAPNDARMRMLTRWESERDVITEFWSEADNQYISLVRSAFANYTEWQTSASKAGIPFAPFISGILPGDAASSIEVNGLSVGIIGLNTAFLQLDNSDFNGRIAVDPRQLHAVTSGDAPAWCGKHDLNFLLTHHPTSWFSTQTLHDFQSEIYPSGRFTAHLVGHMHDPNLLTQFSAGDAGRKHFQSSSLFGMEFLADGATERVHGYSLGKISFQDDVTWRLWPRKAKIVKNGGNRRIIPDHDNFSLVPGKEFLEEKLEKRSPASKSVVIPSSHATDLAVAVEESVKQWSNSLSSTLYNLPEQEQHLAIRPLQQQACIESIRQKNVAWICADWGLGRDGFLWSILKRISRELQPVYRVSLENYASREEFFTSFATAIGCSFAEYCKALAAAGPCVLLLDSAPVSIGEPTSLVLERDVESLAGMVRDFCPNIIIFLLARTMPRQHKISAVALEPLDEADTKSYLAAHPNVSLEVATPGAVNSIYRRTDGIPGKIDSVLKSLRVVSLTELTLSSSADALPVHESIPASLIRAVTDLSESEDPVAKRSYLLLKVLSILPNGESLQRLKRIDNNNPIFPKHAEELLDRDLIQVRSSTSLISGENGTPADRVKVIIAPRPVRDYVLTKMSNREVDTLVKKAIALYFGETWRTGNASLQKLAGVLTSDDGSLLENPHLLVMRLLGQDTTWEAPDAAAPILNLCQTYCSALFTGKYYRNCIAVCRDVLGVIPPTEYESQRNSIEYLLASALRMTSGHTEARALFEKLMILPWPKSSKAQLLLRYALCLQSLGDPKAIDVANEVVKISAKGPVALQAKSIMLDMEDDVDNAGALLQIEQEARKRGFNTVANNLTLGRLFDVDDDISSESLLRKVFSTAKAEGDAYTAARAAVRLGSLSIKETDALSSKDLNNLIESYQYFYGERFERLFLSAHQSLWEYFEKQGDIRNLLSLFRHSSFIWRLHGNEISETKYANRLIEKARHILTTNILTADKNTAYFLVRARNEKTEISE